MTALTHQHFLRQIQAEKDPAQTQGVYSDWLEEQGDPRAVALRLAARVRAELIEGKWHEVETEAHLLLLRLEVACIELAVPTRLAPGEWFREARIPKVTRGYTDPHGVNPVYSWREPR